MAGSMDDGVHRKQLTQILKAGVTTFVCLQAEFDPYVNEMEWKQCQKLRPYFGDAVAIVRQSKQAPPAQQLSQDADSMQFVYFPIIDQNVAPDTDVMLLLEDLNARMNKGEVLYVHCWGGHGRAGTVTACLMAMLQGISCKEALLRVQKYHDTRLETSEYPCQVMSPQRPSQRQQVKRLIEAWHAKYGRNENTEPPRQQKLAPSGMPNPVHIPKSQEPVIKKAGIKGRSLNIDYNGGVRHSFEGSVVQGYNTPPHRQGTKIHGKQQKILFNSPKPKQTASTPSHKHSSKLVKSPMYSNKTPNKHTRTVNPSLSLPDSYRFPSPVNLRGSGKSSRR
jgi:protein-tyrosine phosphatase